MAPGITGLETTGEMSRGEGMWKRTDSRTLLRLIADRWDALTDLNKLKRVVRTAYLRVSTFRPKVRLWLNPEVTEASPEACFQAFNGHRRGKLSSNFGVIYEYRALSVRGKGLNPRLLRPDRRRRKLAAAARLDVRLQ